MGVALANGGVGVGSFDIASVGQFLVFGLNEAPVSKNVVMHLCHGVPSM